MHTKTLVLIDRRQVSFRTRWRCLKSTNIYDCVCLITVMATSVLQPNGRRDQLKADLIEPRVPDDSIHQESEERETGDLPQELREQARVELREELALRDQALTQMRHFIEKHPAIRKCRTGK